MSKAKREGKAFVTIPPTKDRRLCLDESKRSLPGEGQLADT
jgi:hypothetical protein